VEHKEGIILKEENKNTTKTITCMFINTSNEFYLRERERERERERAS